MWILIVIVVLAGAGTALGVSEKKRQEKRRQMAEERRQKRAEALAKAREANKASYDNMPQEEEKSEELDVGAPPAYEPPVEEPVSVQEELEKTQVYEPMTAKDEAVSEDTKVVPEKLIEDEVQQPQKSFAVDESALDVLTGKFDYITEEMEEREEKRRLKQEKKEAKQKQKQEKAQAAKTATEGKTEKPEKPAKAKKKEDGEEKTSKLAVLGWTLGAIACLAAVFVGAYFLLKPAGEQVGALTDGYTEVDNSAQTADQNDQQESQTVEENQSIDEGNATEGETELMPMKTFVEKPHAVTSTQPSNWSIDWEIYGADDVKLLTGDTEEDLTFSDVTEYFALPGVATFRGNHFRNDASYGNVKLESKTFSERKWTNYSASITTGDGESAWTGSGWTGQPLVVQWDEETKQHMNLYESAKAKEGLVEVIYATLDGTIYFMDLETGEYTRDSMYLGMTFKGSGALDPRGYPLMYVGSGDDTVEGKKPRMYIISLIDCSVMYEYGSYDPIALRGWCAFDSSPLVDVETDSLIWPGENGVLYKIKLNTQYNASTGELKIAPELTARARYNTGRSNETNYWLGYEGSVAVIDRYAYLSENGGMFYCVNLDTLELVWAQDTKDDSNSTAVVEFDPETGRGYIYTAPSLHWTAKGGWGSTAIYKLDAITGEIIWQKEYECGTVEGVSGGVQATPVIGKEGTNLENLVIYPIARTPDLWGGAMIAFDKETGKEVWRWDMDYYTWSSPVAVYTETGEGYLVSFDSQGGGFLLDGATGEILDTTDVGSLVEASPVVYENRLVVGTRGQLILGMDLQ